MFVPLVRVLGAVVCEPRITGELDCEDEAQPLMKQPLINANIMMEEVVRIT